MDWQIALLTGIIVAIIAGLVGVAVYRSKKDGHSGRFVGTYLTGRAVVAL